MIDINIFKEELEKHYYVIDGHLFEINKTSLLIIDYVDLIELKVRN
jgi:hypothetical protein